MRMRIQQIPPLNYVAQRFHQYRKRRDFLRQLRQSPLRVVLGASGIFESGWIPTDISQLNVLKESDWQALFTPNSVDALLAEHVWEHLTQTEGTVAISYCFTYLKPGGYIRIAVPDGNHPDPEYIDYVKPGGHGAGAADHKVLYTIDILSPMLEQAGFTVRPLEYFDAAGEFHFNLWQPESGLIHRSSRYDRRNTGGTLKMTSLILDGIKPGTVNPV